MSALATVIGSFLAVLPLVNGYVARSKGRSHLGSSLVSLVLTPFGSLILLLMLPDRGLTDQPSGWSVRPSTLPGSFARIAFGDQAGASELGENLAGGGRDARVDQLIAERLNALKAAPALNTVPTGATTSARPAFGKRR